MCHQDRMSSVRDSRRALLHSVRPIHGATGGREGWVSLEVSPLLAYDAGSTLVQAQELDVRAGLPNLLISSGLVRRLNWFGSRSENWTSRMALSAKYREAETTSKLIRLSSRSIRRAIRCTMTWVRSGSAFRRRESAKTNSQQKPRTGGLITGVDP